MRGSHVNPLHRSPWNVARGTAHRYGPTMSPVPYLTTAHLRLCPAAPEDRRLGEQLHRNPIVRRYLGGPTSEARLPHVLQGYLSPGPREAAWVVRSIEAGEAIGLVTLSNHKDGRDVELSY